MYFTSGSDRAFENLMQGKPGFDHYDSGDAGAPEDCGDCRFYRPDWKYQFCVYAECPYQPGKLTALDAVLFQVKGVDDEMAVFRVEKNRGYTVMSNHHLRNKDLSLKAKGLLSQMLSLPEDWDYTLKGLSLINRESIDAIRTAVWELEKAGYITHLILLNLIYDLSCTAIPWDNVDEEFLIQPRTWDASSIGNFMIWIGPTSSIFDWTTYAFMYFVFCPKFISHGVLYNDLAAHYTGTELARMQSDYAAMFQAGWFIESMWSQTLVIHMIRTPKIPFIQSRASAPVTMLTFIGITVLTVIPFTGFGKILGFVAPPAAFFAYLIPCILLYMALATSLKKAYVRNYGELL